MTGLRDPDDAPAELEGHHFTIWVEGRRTVRAWDDEGRAQADRLSHAASALGLHAFRQRLAEDADQDQGPTRRAWTHRRVGSDDVLGLIVKLPGIRFADLVDRLYRDPPWSASQRAAAVSKARVALHRLKQRGLVAKIYGEQGEERWLVIGSAATPPAELPMTVAIAMPRGEVGPPQQELTADQLIAGAAVLRRLEIYPDHTLRGDPSLYEDLARAVWSAMTPTTAPSPTTSEQQGEPT